MVSRGMLEMRGSGQLRVAADGRPRRGTLRVTGSGAGTPQAAVEQSASPSAPSHLVWVHRGGGALARDARDVTGDVLWAVMICCWLGALAPDARLLQRAVVALLICTAVELSQLVHAPALDVLRSTSAGQLVPGSGFDARDLVASASGVAAATLMERIIRGLTHHESGERSVGS